MNTTPFSLEQQFRQCLKRAHQNPVSSKIHTKPSDWNVTVHQRVTAAYGGPISIELITFSFSVGTEAAETLTECPFEASISNQGLQSWLAS